MQTSDVGCDGCRHSSEPEFSLWKEDLCNADKVVEADLASADDQTFFGKEPTGSLLPTTTHGDTSDLSMTGPQPLRTEETGASVPSCPTTDSHVTVDSSSGSLSHAGVESSSVLEKQEPDLDRCSSDGVAEQSVAAGGPQNSVHVSSASSTAQSDECRDGQNVMNTQPDPSDHGAVVTSSSQAMVSTDSEAVSSSSVKMTVASDTSNSDTVHTADNHSLPAHQVRESVSSENVQPSVSEPQTVCRLHRELSLLQFL